MIHLAVIPISKRMATESLPISVEETISGLKTKVARDMAPPRRFYLLPRQRDAEQKDNIETGQDTDQPMKQNEEKEKQSLNGDESSKKVNVRPLHAVSTPSDESSQAYLVPVINPGYQQFNLIKEDYLEKDNGDDNMETAASSEHSTTTRTRMLYTANKSALDDVDAEFGLTSEDFLSESEFKEIYGAHTKDIMSKFNLREALKPISQPSDVVNIPNIARTYKSKNLDRMAEELIHVIESEQNNVILLSKLMNIFLGDNPEIILEKSLGLPEYDHHLDLNQAEAGQQQQEQEQLIDGMDPFFMLPAYQTDPQLNLDLAEADELRQLVQIALQRNEEFVRSLSQIRNGFVRAIRLRDFVYQWCCEMKEAEENPVEERDDSNDV